MRAQHTPALGHGSLSESRVVWEAVEISSWGGYLRVHACVGVSILFGDWKNTACPPDASHITDWAGLRLTWKVHVSARMISEIICCGSSWTPGFDFTGWFADSLRWNDWKFILNWTICSMLLLYYRRLLLIWEWCVVWAGACWCGFSYSMLNAGQKLGEEEKQKEKGENVS